MYYHLISLDTEKGLYLIFEKFEIRPSAILFVRLGAIFKTSSGKIRRRKIKEAYLSDALAKA